ncbi:MAG: helix-turn-helix domain-containing protein, partial [Deltaproteobacteria bacterium]|nr:helix-turn-helix domain-containing protein [Deltaproteobacteria bacterium]
GGVIGVGMSLRDVEKELIFQTLRASDSNRTQAAKTLGISIRTLRNKLHEYADAGELPDFLSAGDDEGE